MELNFNHFAIKTQPGMEDDPVRAGFLMHRTDRWVGGGWQYQHTNTWLCGFLFGVFASFPSKICRLTPQQCYSETPFPPKSID